MSPSVQKILVVGAAGQIGTELTVALRARYGADNVIASDLRRLGGPIAEVGPYLTLDITSRAELDKAIIAHDIDTIINMAAILSSDGEKNPQLAWNVNINGLYNTLEAAREHKLTRVLCPSSIAAFGPNTPKENTPQETILGPTTMYGITKVTGELLCDYYFRRFGVDARGLRYPGIISSEVLPSGGTTDYAVEIFYHAVEKGSYACFLGPESALPMMYMPDCLKCTMDLLAAPVENLKHHGDFNVAAMSFTPEELAAEIRRHLPDFKLSYEIDPRRQSIADSWPRSIDDRCAREEWGWKPSFDLPAMVADMLERLSARHNAGKLYEAGA
ncbi:L-threonine 3-dehydrogenase [bacterium]|nr:L-threonine 3-dehydrogenase [bacterium]